MVQVVLPGTPATYLFRVARKENAGRPIEQQLRLGIRYRSIREGTLRPGAGPADSSAEALSLVREVVSVALDRHQLGRLSPIARRIAEHLLPPTTDLTLFALLGKLERTTPSEAKVAELTRRFCRTEAEAASLAAVLADACSVRDRE